MLNLFHIKQGSVNESNVDDNENYMFDSLGKRTQCKR